jgi:hypothetical protein
MADTDEHMGAAQGMEDAGHEQQGSLVVCLDAEEIQARLTINVARRYGTELQPIDLLYPCTFLSSLLFVLQDGRWSHRPCISGFLGWEDGRGKGKGALTSAATSLQQ